MKLFKSSRFLLGLGLLSVALTSTIQTAEARPQRDRDANRRGDWRNDRDNDRHKDRDQRRGRRGNRSGGNYGNGNYGNGGGYGNGGNYGYGNSGNYGYGSGNINSGNRNQSFTGRVTNVKSADEFDIRIGGTTYNVYTNARAPRRLSVGDTVRIYGTRVGKNDIRNASASLLNNRW